MFFLRRDFPVAFWDAVSLYGTVGTDTALGFAYASRRARGVELLLGALVSWLREEIVMPKCAWCAVNEATIGISCETCREERRSGNLANFPGATIARQGTIFEIVALLEVALEQAKSGHLIGLGIVKVSRAPLSFSERWHAEAGAGHSLAAGVSVLVYRLAKKLADEDA